ncbi:Canalicular multispecific organic anion transporter 1 [Homalodisca vitripennis]|nr:Canalicular multispecific organic anion transporter 1 [Homalodisca vitripennis]
MGARFPDGLLWVCERRCTGFNGRWQRWDTNPRLRRDWCLKPDIETASLMMDSHVGKHIFENVIGHKGVLKKKTRILVTHAITYLPEVDLIVVLKEGQVTESGTYKELLAQKGAFADFLVQYLQEAGEEDQVDLPEEMTELLESNVELKQKLARQRSRDSESSTHSLQRQRSSSESTNPDTKLLTQNHTAKKQGDKLIEAEKAETGSVKKTCVHALPEVSWSCTDISYNNGSI